MGKIEVPATATKGMGFFGALTLFLTLGFVACKVMGWGVVAGWSWWQVFLPAILYVVVPIALVLLIWALFLLVAGMVLIGATGYWATLAVTRSVKRKYAARK